jgi:hypothetical protein
MMYAKLAVVLAIPAMQQASIAMAMPTTTMMTTRDMVLDPTISMPIYPMKVMVMVTINMAVMAILMVPQAHTAVTAVLMMATTALMAVVATVITAIVHTMTTPVKLRRLKIKPSVH